jgi:hypothetical protein
MDALAPEYMSPDQLNDLFERRDSRANSIRERRNIDFYVFARIGRALPVQWLVQQELGSQDHGEQARPPVPARDRMRGRRRLDALAVPAREFFEHVLDEFPAARLAFERRGHDFAELAQIHAAAFTASARRGIDDALARKIFG